MDMIKLPQMDPEQVANEIGEFILKTVVENKATGCVIGLSGGIDSSVTAALIKRVFAGTDYSLIGCIIPADQSHHEDIQDAKDVADKFEIMYKIIYIGDTINNMKMRIEQYEVMNQYDLGNMISRVRANYLSTFAAIYKKVLSGTGNRDEDYGVGYYTLFGDGAVHMNPIGCLSKRLVYQMATYLGMPDNIMGKPPSAGLEPNQTDFTDLGYSYFLVEVVVEALDREISIVELIETIMNGGFIYDKTRFPTPGDVLADILKRNLTAKQKAKIISPPVPKVTLTYE
jgi:NAD+ synthase